MEKRSFDKSGVRRVDIQEVLDEIQHLEDTKRLISECLSYLGLYKNDFDFHSEEGTDLRLARRHFGNSASRLHHLLEELNIAVRLLEIFQMNEPDDRSQKNA